MNLTRRVIAAAEVLLVFPAALFMTSLFVRNLQPLQYEPAHSAQRIVDWYAARPHLGLWVFLSALPLAVFISGCWVLLSSWRADDELRRATVETLGAIGTHLATILVAGATLTAGGILAMVALHLMTD
jgi:hypothetical protein